VEALAPFEEVVCCVDASDESLEAARQAARLVTESGRLVLVGMANLASAGLVFGGQGAMVESLAAETREALERAMAEAENVASVETESLIGLPPRDLLHEAERLRATLLVVGTHGRSRPLGALLGSVASTAVHQAPSSVLVARPAAEMSQFPRSIVCGLDGSSEAARAGVVAAKLAARFKASIAFIVAEDDKNVDLELARGAVVGDHARLDVAPGKPVDALVAASEGADLLVVGSRQLQGVRAIGSVSERVAHEAASSVLVAR
jgi:nucleotide-binding universal stress UspA family protein